MKVDLAVPPDRKVPWSIQEVKIEDAWTAFSSLKLKLRKQPCAQTWFVARDEALLLLAERGMYLDRSSVHLKIEGDV